MDTTKIELILESRAEESKKPSRTEVIGELFRKNFKDGEINGEFTYVKGIQGSGSHAGRKTKKADQRAGGSLI